MKSIKKNKLIVIGILIGLPVMVFLSLFYFDTMRSFLVADATDTDEPWSIVVVAGQSWAEGTNSFLVDMPEGQKLGQHPADDTQDPEDNAYLWWEGANGASVQDSPNAFWDALANPNYNPAGWIKSKNTIDTDPIIYNSGLINFKDLSNPAPTVKQRNNQFGPEIGIARRLYDKGRRKIIVLKVSYGFQSLAKSTSQFIPYDWNPDCTGNRSDKSYCHLTSAYTELTNYIKNVRNEKYTVDGFYWFQGGTDTLDTTYAEKYQENFDLLVRKVRSDLQLQPQAHFVAQKFSMRTCIDHAYPAVGDFCGFAYALRMEGVSAQNILDALTVNAIQSIPLNSKRIKQVRNALQTVADDYPWVDVVETDDAPFSGDFIHMNATGQLIMGKRMADMFELPFRAKTTDPEQKRNDYDGDNVDNSAEDTGRGADCEDDISYEASGNANLGDDDSDCDGFPNYLDAIDGPGSGMRSDQ